MQNNLLLYEKVVMQIMLQYLRYKLKTKLTFGFHDGFRASCSSLKWGCAAMCDTLFHSCLLGESPNTCFLGNHTAVGREKTFECLSVQNL